MQKTDNVLVDIRLTTPTMSSILRGRNSSFESLYSGRESYRAELREQGLTNSKHGELSLKLWRAISHAIWVLKKLIVRGQTNTLANRNSQLVNTDAYYYGSRDSYLKSLIIILYTQASDSTFNQWNATLQS